MQVTGTLKSINQKHGKGKNGPWTLYRIGVDTGKPDYEWFGFGFEAPKVAEGSLISFEATEGKYGWDADPATVKLEKKASAVAQKYNATQDTKQDSIVRQNATSTAVAALNTMIANDFFKLPPMAKRYDWYLAQLDELVNRLFLANREPLSPEEVRAALGDEEVEEAIDEGAADDDDWEPV